MASLSDIKGLLDAQTATIAATIDTKITTALTPVTEKLQRMDKRMDAQDDRLGKVEKQILDVKGGASAQSSGHPSLEGRFVPAHVEIKGICEFKERKTKGISRDEAETLVARLIEKLPQSIKHKVGEIEVYGSRGHKFKVNIKPPDAIEISLIWKEHLKEDDSFTFNGKVLWASAQREPAEQRRFEAGGRARAYLDNKAKQSEPDATAVCSWQPSWALSVQGTMGDAVVGTVQEDGTVSWSPEALLATFGITVDAAKVELVAFRQP